MDRRNFIAGALSATAIARLAPAGLIAACANPAGAAVEGIDVVERFGFVGDGRTDNYEAFHRFADFVNANRGGSYVFPPGEYYVHRWRTAPQGTRDRRFVVNSEIIGCDGLTISGYGAKIRLNGRFHRSGRKGLDGLTVGIHTSTFMPFEIRQSRNVTIQGFEMDGGVRSMTRDPEVYEGYAHLIALNACTDVTLKDLNLHHAQVDAVYLSDDAVHTNVRPARACRNIVLTNVKGNDCGRGGLAPLQVYGLRATDCEFNRNGFPGGKYLYHAPGFGVCFEPDRSSPADVDTRTGNCEFVRCNFHDNISAILAAYMGNYRGYCRFIDCNSSNRNAMPNHMILTWPGEGIVIDGGSHDAGDGCLWLSWAGWKGSKSTLRRMKIRSSHIHGLLHPEGGNVTVVEDCEITGTHRKAESGHFPFFGQDPGGGRRNVFRRNRLFIPAARKDKAGAFDLEPNFHNTNLSDNEYRTDLAVPGQAFVRLYNPDNCSVRNERFRGAFPGTRDTFRPLANEAHDSRQPFTDL